MDPTIDLTATEVFNPQRDAPTDASSDTLQQITTLLAGDMGTIMDNFPGIEDTGMNIAEIREGYQKLIDEVALTGKAFVNNSGGVIQTALDELLLRVYKDDAQTHSQTNIRIKTAAMSRAVKLMLKKFEQPTA